MNKKLSNDQNIKNLKKRKILRTIIICFSILTIVLAILSLFFNVNILFSLLSYIITHILMKYRESIPINKVDELKYIKKTLNKSKK